MSRTSRAPSVWKKLAIRETLKATVIQDKKTNISGARRFIENLLPELYRELLPYLVRGEVRKYTLPTSTGLII